jgi:anthranilate synthase component 2/para-aminobenzoate synthetase component 2
MHGKTSLIYHDGKTIYEGLASPFEAGRYHSLSIEQGTLPPYLKVTAVTEDGEVMGVRHERFVVEGVQFHPESILTEVGHHILKRFLSISNPLWGEKG